MKRIAPVVALSLVLLAWVTVGKDSSVQALAQSPAASKAGPSAASDDAKPARKQPAGRLPNNYGKLDLSGEQRAKIYEIQATYDEQLDALMEQMVAMKSKRDAEIAGVLTAEQKSRLAKLLEEAAAKKKTAKSSAATSKTVTDASK